MGDEKNKTKVILDIVVIVTSILMLPAQCYETFVPSSRCSSMKPGHGAQLSGNGQHSIEAVDSSGNPLTQYAPGQQVTVKVIGTMQGLLLQARPSANYAMYLGTWSNPPANTKTFKCSISSDSVSHSNTRSKVDPTFTWIAPSTCEGSIQFVSTISKNKEDWYLKVTSNVLTCKGGVNTTGTNNSVQLGQTPEGKQCRIRIKRETDEIEADDDDDETEEEEEDDDDIQDEINQTLPWCNDNQDALNLDQSTPNKANTSQGISRLNIALIAIAGLFAVASISKIGIFVAYKFL